jgi:hypothetical protein
MITQSETNNTAFLVGLGIGAVLGIFLLGYVFRLAVRIVARFTPGYGTVYAALILAFFAAGATGFVIGLIDGFFRLVPSTDIRFLAVAWLVSFVIGIAVLGQAIKSPNGVPLGFMKAFLVYMMQTSLNLIISGALVAIAVGLLGYQKVINISRVEFANYVRMAHSLQARGSASFHFPAHPWGINPFPSIQPTPVPEDHYYLRSPLVVRVSYGTITLPARTEVRLINQTGDSCEIQFGDNTYTVSSGELAGVP